jgi:nucleoside-diphosphate-sugar epimerase
LTSHFSNPKCDLFKIQIEIKIGSAALMEKILLIGASGFVGTDLIRVLKGSYELINLDKRMSDSHPDITVLGNVCDLESMDSYFKDISAIILLAAEHRDDVTPISKYYDVNVDGAKNVVALMDKYGIKRLIFTSSVAVYGLNKDNPDEGHAVDPFNHYGISKWQAEQVLNQWYEDNPDGKSLTIIRPTVIFGENNRGNVYNLLKQITSGRFVRVGDGENKKSMSYIRNITAFIEYLVNKNTAGRQIYNYADKPDFTMNELITEIEKTLPIKIPAIKVPFFLGMVGGYLFDIMAFIIQKKMSISSVRIKKFCATTQFDSTKVEESGFEKPFTIGQGLANTLNHEFID